MVNVELIHSYGGSEFAARMNKRSRHNQVMKLVIESENGKTIHKLTVNEAIEIIGKLEDVLDEIKHAEQVINSTEEAGA